MKGSISIDDVTSVVEYVAMQADDATNTSGLKEEYRSVMYAGWCCALDMVIFSLGLPVDTDSDPDDSKLLQAAIAKFADVRKRAGL